MYSMYRYPTVRSLFRSCRHNATYQQITYLTNKNKTKTSISLFTFILNLKELNTLFCSKFNQYFIIITLFSAVIYCFIFCITLFSALFCSKFNQYFIITSFHTLLSLAFPQTNHCVS